MIDISHINKSLKDSLGSERYKCYCGTHFNSNPKYFLETLAWLIKHSKCSVRFLTSKH